MLSKSPSVGPHFISSINPNCVFFSPGPPGSASKAALCSGVTAFTEMSMGTAWGAAYLRQHVEQHQEHSKSNRSDFNEKYWEIHQTSSNTSTPVLRPVPRQRSSAPQVPTRSSWAHSSPEDAATCGGPGTWKTPRKQTSYRSNPEKGLGSSGRSGVKKP